MQFNVARLLQGSVGAEKTYTLSVSFPPLEDTHTDYVQGRLKLTRIDNGIWVSGALKTPVRYTCSRCLQQSSVSVQFQIDDLYYPSVDVDTGAALPLPEEAENHCVIDSHHVLDITETVRQYAMVSLPMKPLCRADCAGLCPQCGVNLNEITCSCEAQPVDSRWLPLLELVSFPRRQETRS